jgi:hypothetical protein
MNSLTHMADMLRVQDLRCERAAGFKGVELAK